MKWPFALRVAVCLAIAIGVTTGSAGSDVVAMRGLARSTGGPVADAVVWLDAPVSEASGARTGRVVLDQRNLTFEPRVLVVRVGTTVDFPNNDRVFHNVFSFRDGKRFDLGMYPVGVLRRVTFDKPGLSRIFCNIHPNMAAYVMAVDTPYFAVSDRSGAFAIGSVANRTYTYHAWKAGTPEQTGSWTAAPGTTLTIDWP
jgi:plastocyanin